MKEIKDVIIKLDSLKEELDNLRPLSKDRTHRLHQKLRLDWNYHSNSIEGNTLSKSETKSFILWGITAKGKPFRDYVEMNGHNEALQKLFQIVHQDLKITEQLIKDFHQMILVKPYTNGNAEVNPGQWKKLHNYLYSPTGERIDFVPPEEVPQRMSDLVNWLNNHIDPPKRKKKKYNLHPLLIAAGFHARFIQIHPFGDGNGRMARILTNLILMLCGYVPAIIKTDNRVNYYTAINTSGLNDSENLAIFIGNAAIESLEMAIAAAKGESIEEENDIDKELQILEQKLKTQAEHTPIKTLDKIKEVLKKESFPFFDKCVLALTKFKPLFENGNYQLRVNSNIYSIKNLEQKKTDILLQLTERKITKIHLIYSLHDLKNSPLYFEIEINIKLDFKRAEYTYSDNLTKKNITLKYNQSLSGEVQKNWIKEIQKELLTQIKKITA